MYTSSTVIFITTTVSSLHDHFLDSWHLSPLLFTSSYRYCPFRLAFILIVFTCNPTLDISLRIQRYLRSSIWFHIQITLVALSALTKRGLKVCSVIMSSAVWSLMVKNSALVQVVHEWNLVAELIREAMD